MMCILEKITSFFFQYILPFDALELLEILKKNPTQPPQESNTTK